MVLSQDTVHLLLTLQLVLKNAQMSLAKGFFRTFPKNKKVRSWLRTRVRGCPPVAAHPRRVRLRERHAGKTYYWNRRTHSTVWQAPAVVEVVWYGERNEEGGVWYWHRDTRVSPRLTSLLFLLGEELYRQPREVYKYWAGGLRSCDHAATSSSSSSSSTSLWFRSSSKCWTFLLCYRDRYPQCNCAGCCVRSFLRLGR